MEHDHLLGNLPITIHPLDEAFMASPLGGQLVRAYQEVFGAEPWYEQYRCVECPGNDGADLQFPMYLKEDGVSRCIRTLPEDLVCTKCNNDKGLEAFWPEERVRAVIAHELSLPDACGLVVCHEGRVIGFCIGFCASAEYLEEHLGLAGLAEVIAEQSSVQKLAYLSDIAVISDYRRKGLARLMFQLRQEAMLRFGPGAQVFRSRPDAITYRWYTNRFGFSVVDRYNRVNDNDVRMILMLDSNTLTENSL